MTNENLKKANELNGQILSLKNFISNYKKSFFIRLFRINHKNTKTGIRINESVYMLTERQKNKILEFLKNDLEEMQQEFERLGTENE